MSEPEPRIVIPDGIEPIIAWRQWKFTPLGQLLPMNAGHRNGNVWEPRRRAEAWCAHTRTQEEVNELVKSLTDPAHLKLTTRVIGGIEYASQGFLAVPNERLRLYAGELVPISDHDDLTIVQYPEPHLPPAKGCSCGLYARKLPETTVNGAIVGTVALWGRIRRGTLGYRAQYGYPHELYVVYGSSRKMRRAHQALADRVERLYQVPVHCVAEDGYLDVVTEAMYPGFLSAVEARAELAPPTEPNDELSIEDEECDY